MLKNHPKNSWTRIRMRITSNIYSVLSSGVTRRRGRPPRVTPSRGWHPNEKKFVGEFTKNSEQTRSDRWKSAGWHPLRGWHPGEINKSDSDWQKMSSVFEQKINRGDTADWQTVMNKNLKRSSVFFRKNKSDTLSCRPGWHQPPTLVTPL